FNFLQCRIRTNLGGSIGTLHHVMVRGIEKRRLVDDETDRRNLVRRFGALAEETRTPIYAWALMINHDHLACRENEDSSRARGELRNRGRRGRSASVNLDFRGFEDPNENFVQLVNSVPHPSFLKRLLFYLVISKYKQQAHQLLLLSLSKASPHKPEDRQLALLPPSQ